VGEPERRAGGARAGAGASRCRALGRRGAGGSRRAGVAAPSRAAQACAGRPSGTRAWRRRASDGAQVALAVCAGAGRLEQSAGADVGEPRPWGLRRRSTGGAGAGACRRARKRSCGGELLREMRERGDHIEDAVKVFDEMPAAGEAKPSLRIVSHQTSDSGKHAGGASHSDGSKSEIGMIESIEMLNVKVMGGKRRMRDAEDARWLRRVDASSLAREMHEERRAGRRGGEAKAATECNELGGAMHGELPSSIRRSRQKQHSADLTRSTRPAVVVGRP
jgi:hypothetical protein